MLAGLSCDFNGQGATHPLGRLGGRTAWLTAFFSVPMLKLGGISLFWEFAALSAIV